MTPNQVRSRAEKVVSPDPDKMQAARDAWARVYGAIPEFEGANKGYLKQQCSRRARLAMLAVLADGGSVEDAERAGLEAFPCSGRAG